LLADPIPWWDRFVIGQHISTLAIRAAHIRKLAQLPDIHKSPFDRILVAQALAARLTIATKDAMFERYGDDSLGVEMDRCWVN
jgi:PIN domain nuclease of toxin-antitoxin system